MSINHSLLALSLLICGCSLSRAAKANKEMSINVNGKKVLQTKN